MRGRRPNSSVPRCGGRRSQTHHAHMAEAPPKRSECGVYDCGSSPSEAAIVCKTSWRSCLVKCGKNLAVGEGSPDCCHSSDRYLAVERTGHTSAPLRYKFLVAVSPSGSVLEARTTTCTSSAWSKYGWCTCLPLRKRATSFALSPSRGLVPPTISETRIKKKKPNCSAQERPLPHTSEGRALLALANMRGVTGLRLVTGPLLRRIPSRARRSRGSGLSGSGKPSCRWTLRIAPNLAWAVAAARPCPTNKYTK